MRLIGKVWALLSTKPNSSDKKILNKILRNWILRRLHRLINPLKDLKKSEVEEKITSASDKSQSQIVHPKREIRSSNYLAKRIHGNFRIEIWVKQIWAKLIQT